MLSSGQRDQSASHPVCVSLQHLFAECVGHSILQNAVRTYAFIQAAGGVPVSPQCRRHQFVIARIFMHAIATASCLKRELKVIAMPSLFGSRDGGGWLKMYVPTESASPQPLVERTPQGIQ